MSGKHCRTKRAMGRLGWRMKACSKFADTMSTCSTCRAIDEWRVLAPGGLVSFRKTPTVLHRIASVAASGAVTIAVTNSEDGTGEKFITWPVEKCEKLLIAQRGIPRGCKVIYRFKGKRGHILIATRS